MNPTVNCGLTRVKRPLTPLPMLPSRIHNQPMVDKETRKRAIKTELARLDARGVGPAAILKRLKESGLPSPKSRQAVYKWFETGAVADQYIPALAFAARVDSDHLQLYGEFKPPRPGIESTAETDTAFDIYSAARNIPEEAQQAVLTLLEIMVSMQASQRRARS